MAILSKKLNLVVGVWQEIGVVSFIGQKEVNCTMEIVNADALPVGDVDEAQTIVGGINLHFLAPLDGSLYVRVIDNDSALTYYEV